MKYSLITKKNGRRFRYCYEDEILEVIGKNIYGETIVTDWMSMSKKNWKCRRVRRILISEFAQKMDEADFGRQFNVVMN